MGLTEIKFKNLADFATYCEKVMEEDNTLWLLSIMASGLTKAELLLDITKAYNVYYKWMAVAVNDEWYHIAGLIHSAIEEEEAHYKALAKAVIKTPITKELKEIHSTLKEKHLGIDGK